MEPESGRACLPFPPRLPDPLPKVMLCSSALSESEPSPALCLMAKEVFLEEVGSQILGPERTSKGVSAILQVATHPWRWEQWSGAGLL